MKPMRAIRLVAVCALTAFGAAAIAATFTVTSPTDGDFLGRSNKVNFNVRGAVREVRVTVRATKVDDPNVSVQIERRFNPNQNGEISDSIDLNFAESTPEGEYRIEVTPVESGNTYDPIPPVSVTVDVAAPRFINLNPIDGGYVRGVVPISVDLNEPNVDTWRVQINQADIPGNSGNAQSFVVNWDTQSILRDGPARITVNVDDRAKNNTNRTVNVTLDRLQPNSNIVTPRPDTPVRPNQSVPVFVQVNDQFNGSVSLSGVTVVATTLDGRFLARVSRRGSEQNGNTLSWFGRLRINKGLPSEFKIVVQVTDRAGNQAVVQETQVKFTDRGRESGDRFGSGGRKG